MLFVSTPGIGLADESGDRRGSWHLGVGLTSADVSAGSFGGIGAASRANSDGGHVLTGGYRFGTYLAIEAGVFDAGEPAFASRRGLICNEPSLCVVDVEQETSGVTVAALGILPLGEIWEIYGKLGAASWDADARQSLASPSGAVTAAARVERSGTALLIGLGVSARVAERLKVRLDYQWFDTDDDLLAVNRAAGLQMTSIELHWQFR